MKSKKAQKSEPITEGFIGPGLAVVALVVLIFTGTKMYAALAPTDKFVSTENNFDVLIGKITELLEDDNKFVATKKDDPLQFSINSKYILVGFNKEGKIEDGCQYETATKPDECLNKACLCTYKDTVQKGIKLLRKKDNDFDKRGNNFPIKCQTLNEVDYIFTLEYTPKKTKTKEEEVLYLDNVGKEQKEKIYKNIIGGTFNPTADDYPDNYAYFFLYGQCEDWSKDKNFNTADLYIEIFRDNGKTYLFIAPKTEYTNKRYEDMIKKYPIKLTEFEYKKKIESAIEGKSYKKVIDYYESFLKIYPKSTLTTNNLYKIAQAYDTNRQYDAALEVYNDLLTKEQNKTKLVEIRYNIGIIYEQKGEKDNALLEYKKIIANYIKPDNPEIYPIAEDKITLLETP